MSNQWYARTSIHILFKFHATNIGTDSCHRPALPISRHKNPAGLLPWNRLHA